MEFRRVIGCCDRALFHFWDILSSGRLSCGASRMERTFLAIFHLFPSSGTPGEGWGEGEFEGLSAFDVLQKDPHPIPLPEYLERGIKPIAQNGGYAQAPTINAPATPR
jgi:hypothetical protein